jgi:hypothetical protein
MKTILPVGIFSSVLAVASVVAATAGSNPGFVAHEWGTFTSVQGPDGTLLAWRPLETSRLPGFVYDWKNPGLNRFAGGLVAFGKGSLVTLQRMETPVIYFYSDHPQMVDVSVKFPQGMITEWFPQAAQIGPSFARVPPFISTVDSYTAKAGAGPNLQLAPLFSSATLTNSEIRWKDIAVLPTNHKMLALPTDPSGSHYFAARDTDASVLRGDSSLQTNSRAENEKFLFYRGAGSFVTPLHASFDSDQTLTLENNGNEALEHLFVLSIENGLGAYAPLDALQSGKKEISTVPSCVPARPAPLPVAQLQLNLSNDMVNALIAAGLYQKEATAMVNTWKDSWFAEDGVRVLYILPRPWTDRTLPVSINPAPRELVRVMVGRAEVLTPSLKQRLATEARDANGTDAQARERLSADLKKLGRFAEPALRVATKDFDTATTQTAWTLLQGIAQEPATAKFE